MAVVFYLVNMIAKFKGGSAAAGLGVLLLIVIIVLYLLIFANHLILCNDHSSRYNSVYFSQILVLAVTAISIIQTVATCIVVHGRGVAVLEIISWQIALIAFLGFIVLVESKLNEFKALREQRKAAAAKAE